MDSDNTSATIQYGTADWFATSPAPYATLWIEDLGVYVHFCALAVIIPVGLVCNAFSIGVFVAAAKFRQTSTGQLLIALSAVDWLVLVGDALRWMTKVDNKAASITGLNFYHTSDFACKFVNSWRYRCITLMTTLIYRTIYDKRDVFLIGNHYNNAYYR